MGARDWQADAIFLLRAFGFEGWIFNPRRVSAFSEEYDVLEEQVDWERDHLKKAACILFWLPAGTEGLTSRWEIAEFAARGKQLVVGIEEGFLRKKYIRHALEKDYGASTEVHDSLEETCIAAAAYIHQQATKVRQNKR